MVISEGVKPAPIDLASAVVMMIPLEAILSAVSKSLLSNPIIVVLVLVLVLLLVVEVVVVVWYLRKFV